MRTLNSHFDTKPLFTFSYAHRTLQLTREGGGFVFLVFGVGMGAINTGNNLLYLVLAMCCSFIVVSGVLSEYTFKGIKISASLPKTLYAEEPYPLHLSITNTKKWFPSFSLNLIFKTNLGEHYHVDQNLYLFQVPPGATLEKSVMLTATQRGPLKIQQIHLKTSFPFGFFIKIKSVRVSASSLVYPAIREVELPAPTDLAEEGEGVIGQRGDDLYSLREFRPGDPMSMVHWKSTAKTGDLRVKEFAQGGFHSFTLFLNILDPETNAQVDFETLENRIIETASLAYHLIRRGDEVSLKTNELHTPYGNSEGHLESIMHTLAWIGHASEARDA